MSLTLVTGAPGWLGTRLVEVLARPPADFAGPRLEPARVRCLVLPGADEALLTALSERVEVVRGDLRDASSLAAFCAGARGATLYHSAGVIHPTRGTAEFTAVNVDGTRNLLDAAARAGVKRIVAVSSNSPLGTNPRHDHVFDESAPYRPYMGYGRSKMRMETLVRERHAQGDLEAVIARPPWFYGPRQPPRQALFFHMIRTGKVPLVGSGENRRSMAYVDNICHGLLLAAASPKAAGETYWIADRRPYSMNEIIDTIERLLEKEFAMTVAHRRMRLPGLASDVARLADRGLQALGLYHQKIHVLSEMNCTIACSIDKARRELGYEPAIALEEGMRRSIRDCLDRGLAI